MNFTFGCKSLDLYVCMCTVLGHSCAKIFIECSHTVAHYALSSIWTQGFKIRPVVILHIDFNKIGPTDISLWVDRSVFKEHEQHMRPHSPPCGYIVVNDFWEGLFFTDAATGKLLTPL